MIALSSSLAIFCSTYSHSAGRPAEQATRYSHDTERVTANEIVERGFWRMMSEMLILERQSRRPCARDYREFSFGCFVDV